MAIAGGTCCRAALGSLVVATPSNFWPPQRCSVVLQSTFVGSCLLSGGCNNLVIGPVARRSVLVRAAAAPTKKPDQAAKRARQSEKRRVYHKSKKSEISTRMKKVFVALDVLKKKTDASEEDFKHVEKLISEAFKIIDKAAQVSSIHVNKAGHQKSRLSRAKRTVLIQLGMYTPTSASSAPSAPTSSA
nr:hypothetical protein PHYPA_025089 [Physcomitrium patens]